ncbi:MAG: hypothetical protein HYR73_07480 [Candidatus Eisenbacteria bacterium]|nr:hypothetical protein [Candidatus Eisenbacteria bacterium]
MNRLRWILPSLALAALTATGCIILSGQIFAHYDLPDPFTIDSSSNILHRELVDLNTVSEYKDNKDKLKGLSDVAVVGKFTNLAGSAGAVEVWITKDPTAFTTVAQVMAGATKLWGPASIGAAVASHNINWDESSKLFTSDGKKMLIDEVKGDGVFTIYVFGTAGTYLIKVDHGAILLVIDAGK